MANLQTLTITTKSGSTYSFPDVDAEGRQLWALVKRRDMTSVTFVNASEAVLVLPVRIIASVSIEGEEIWDCHA